MLFPWRVLLLVMLLAGALLARGWAADGVVTAVEPTLAGQGETVLLTITGESLPQGTLVLEFYPQQIALLDILAASEREIQALVKVVHTAPPGKYNVMVYNQRGEEAFGSELLEVTASVITPVFKSYDPKVIVDASTGFALLLTGEYITPAAVDHLTIEWQQNDSKISGLTSTFSIGGNRAIVCAVEGQPPPGVLRGRVFLDGVPIYLIELTVEGGSAVIIGHTPAQLDANKNPLTVRLLGSELTAHTVQGLSVELSNVVLAAKAQQVVLLDSASCQVEFNGPLPAGEYTLSVVSGGSLVYSSTAELITTGQPDSEIEQATESGSDNVSSTQQAEPAPPIDAIASSGESEPTSPQLSDPEIRQPMTEAESEASFGISELESSATEQTPKPSLKIENVEPAVIDPSLKACRFTLTTSGVDEQLLQELTPTLKIGEHTATLLLSGSSAGEMTCVFSPPAGGWPAGASGELALQLGDTGPASATYTVIVGQAAPAPQTASAPAPGAIAAPPATQGEVWLAQSVYIAGSQGLSTLAVSIEPPMPGYELALLEGSFTLLPDELGYTSAIDNLALTGQLQFRQGVNGLLVGEFPGNFISGSLMITLRYQGGTPQLSMLRLDAPMPQLRVAMPGIDTVLRGVDGAWQPPSLRWTIDVAPLVLADAQFISLVDAAGVPVPTVVSISGTQAVMECSADALYNDGEVCAKLELSLPFKVMGAMETVIPVQDEQVTAEQITVGEPTEATTIGEVKLLESRLHVCDDGLWFVIAVPSHGIALAGWRELEAETSDILLQPNLEKFAPEVVPVDSASLGQAIRILLRRDRQALADDAYGLLCTQLLETGRCRLTVTWPGIGYQLNDEVELDEHEWSSGSLLKELGLGGETAV